MAQSIGKRILLVENETLTAKTEKVQLEKYGYAVRTVTTGENAVKAVKTSSDIDLILMDIDLADEMDGTRAAELILKDHAIPIVFLSSHTEPETVQRTEKITSYGYVVKSSSATILDASIKMAFKLFNAESAHKQVKEELRESEKRLALATQSAELGIWDWDIVNNDMTWNEQMFRLYGVSDIPEDYGVEIWENGLHPDDREFAMEAAQAAVRGEKEYDIDFRVRWADGSVRYVHGTAVVIRADDGTPLRMTGINDDITKRKQAEEALAQKTKLQERSQALANLGSWEWDMVHDAWHFSEQWKKIHGLSDNDLATAKLLEIAHPDDAPDIEKAFTDAREHGKTYDIEHRIIRADDKEIRHIKALGEAEFDQETGRPVRMVGASQDITERKLAQEEIQKQLAEKETLLREVHHRVKNNIAQIEGLLSLQAGSTANAEVKAALQDAISRVQSMRVLYDKLLLSDDHGEISIKNYAEGLIDSLVMAFDSGKNITIEKHISEFVIDARKAISIGIIINELLTNVFKYAFKDRDSGIVSVSIDTEENNVTLIIEDNGVGIDEKAEENKSPGFGLTIVKLLVEQLCGTYRIVNENGAKGVVQFKI